MQSLLWFCIYGGLILLLIVWFINNSQTFQVNLKTEEFIHKPSFQSKEKYNLQIFCSFFFVEIFCFDIQKNL